MKRITAVLAALMQLFFLSAARAEAAPEDTVWTTELQVRFATEEEGRQLMRDRVLFHDQINEGMLAFLLQRKGGTLEEYIEFSEEQVMPFSPAEEKRITDTVAWLKDVLERHGLKLPDPGTLTFVKSTSAEACWAAAYTTGGIIFVADYVFSPLVYTDDDFREMVVHEVSHCLSRMYPEYRQALFSQIHFTVLDHEIDVPEEILNRIIANPDVEHHDSSAVFTIGGEKKECYLVFLADSVFEEPGDSFFDTMYSGIVPMDGSVVYREDEVDDFWEVVGRNSDYVEDPEELMAANAAFAILHLDDGYSAYQSPEILEGVIDYLRTAHTGE